MKRLKRVLVGLSFVVVLAALAVLTPFVPQAGQQQETTSGKGGCLGEGAVLADFQRMRTELETERKKIADRESELTAREQAVEEMLKNIQQVRDQIATMQELRKSENEAQVAKLVETFETMSPKAAAKLLATVDEALAVSAISRIETPRLAKIMNLMEPQKSSRLSELLTGVARVNRSPSSASNGAAAATKNK